MSVMRSIVSLPLYLGMGSHTRIRVKHSCWGTGVAVWGAGDGFQSQGLCIYTVSAVCCHALLVINFLTLRCWLQPPGSATAPTSSSNFGRISNTSNLGPAPGSTSGTAPPPLSPPSPPLPSPAPLTFNNPVLHRPLDGERSSDDTVHHSSGFQLQPYQGGCRSIDLDPCIDPGNAAATAHCTIPRVSACSLCQQPR